MRAEECEVVRISSASAPEVGLNSDGAATGRRIARRSRKRAGVVFSGKYFFRLSRPSFFIALSDAMTGWVGVYPASDSLGSRDADCPPQDNHFSSLEPPLLEKCSTMSSRCFVHLH